MKTKKKRTSSAQRNYVTPVIFALSIYSGATPLRAASGVKHECVLSSTLTTPPLRRYQVRIPTVTTAGIPAPNDASPGAAVRCVPKSPPCTYRIETKKTFCVGPHQTASLQSMGINTMKICRVRIKSPVGVLHSPSTSIITSELPAHLAQLYNALTAIAAHEARKNGFEARSYGSDTTRVKNNAVMLVEVTLGLVMKELNKIPGSIKLERGELIDAFILTPEQRVVLQEHMGLIKEAIRQFRAEQSKNVPAQLEPNTDGIGSLDNTGSTDESR